MNEPERLLILSNVELHGLGMKALNPDGAVDVPLILVTVTGLYTQRNQLWRDAPTRSLEFAVAPEAAGQLAAALLQAVERFGAEGRET